MLGEDDIAFADFGPIFEDWEADFGRTFVLGDDPVKHALRDALPKVFDAGRAYFDALPDITGEQLYAHMVQLAHEAGWEFGGEIAGHLVGRFPHETIDGARIASYIAPGSDQPMQPAGPRRPGVALDPGGPPRRPRPRDRRLLRAAPRPGSRRRAVLKRVLLTGPRRR